MIHLVYHRVHLYKCDVHDICYSAYLCVHTYTYTCGVDGSVGQPKTSKPEVPGSTPGSS